MPDAAICWQSLRNFVRSRTQEVKLRRDNVKPNGTEGDLHPQQLVSLQLAQQCADYREQMAAHTFALQTLSSIVSNNPFFLKTKQNKTNQSSVRNAQQHQCKSPAQSQLKKLLFPHSPLNFPHDTAHPVLLHALPGAFMEEIKTIISYVYFYHA